MDVFFCGHNSFNQLDWNNGSFHLGDRPISKKCDAQHHCPLPRSVFQPSCQLTLVENADKSDIDIHFTWSMCIISIKTDNERHTTYIAGSNAKKRFLKVAFENSIFASSVEGNGMVLLKDSVDPNSLSVVHCGMSEPLPLIVRRDENQTSGLDLQVVAGGHKDIYAVYDGVNFGKFKLPSNLNIPHSKSEVDSETRPPMKDKEVRLTIQHIDYVTPIKEVSCGKEHVLLLSRSGNVYSYGLSSRGQLGHSVIEAETSPRLVDALDGLMMKTVAAGGWHSAAVSEIGDIYSWGWNESGQLGLKSAGEGGEPKGKGHEKDDNVGIVAMPVCLVMPNDANVKEVACGSRHTVVLTETGEIFTCGWNAYGQLGLGDFVNRDRLTRVAGVTSGCMVFAGHWNTAFLCSQNVT